MKNFILFILLALPATLLTVNNGPLLAYGQEDEIVDDTVEIEGDDGSVVPDDEIEEDTTKASADAETVILFTKPVISSAANLELPAGVLVEFLVGFTNKGEVDFTLDTVDASFRYPMDFNFHIQNFSTITYNKVVKPNHEATVAYSFIPSEVFAGRPFGLNINLNYRDANGLSFTDAVYNETIQIVELDEGLDGETVFLYVFLAACAILTLVGGQQLLSSFGRKSRFSSSRKPPVEMGTSNPNNVDYDWLPKDTLNRLSKSPRTPKQSPRQRKAKRAAGSDD
ncbi:translocon-associated protein subunit alpha [Athalia rosae]|uniref:translocon-associated protein subunit alpha n=1 Tax=Athalia rosae TaxID=37344 RepID=UPI000625CF32|nr:translocon-associated protein subunit alpha [Athalia rosae]